MTETETLADLLFPPSVSYIDVRCWSCGHTKRLRPSDLPAGIAQAAFESKARCGECGVGWPHVEKYPKPKSRW